MSNTTNIILPAKENMTFHQRQLRRLIIDYRQELIGGQENHYLDSNKDDYNNECPAERFTKKWAVDTIYHWIMDNPLNRRYLCGFNCRVILERQHIRFMGEAFVRALIEDRVEYDYRKNGWAFPNNYDGVDPIDEAIEQLKSHQYYHFNDGKRERWFKIMQVNRTTVRMLELPQHVIHVYKLEGDVLKEMIEDKTGTCEDTYGGTKQ